MRTYIFIIIFSGTTEYKFSVYNDN